MNCDMFPFVKGKDVGWPSGVSARLVRDPSGIDLP